MVDPTSLDERRLRDEILERTRQLARLRLAKRPFNAASTPVPYAGRVYDEDEVTAGVSSMLDFWLTLGPEGDAFEKELASYLGVRSSLLVNSGSSANLVALSALTSHKLGERRIKPGDEIITAAAGFPTTVAPIIQNRAVPVFIDSDPLTGNARVDQLEDAYVPGRTKAVMMAHTLGNPFDLGEISRFCREHNLWLIEDNCDALGSRYGGRLTGGFGDLSTQSFYPPHHLTMGEGGAVNIVAKPLLKVLAESFRDWGRDCWCPSGKDDTCGKRFDWTLGELPRGYDHKYIYSHLGYNLKPTDPQAAIGRAQLRKLSGFIEARARNWDTLRQRLAPLEDVVDFMLPTHASGWSPSGFSWKAGQSEVQPSWFGFMMLITGRSPCSRRDLAAALDRARVGNRMLFGGNLLRQPAFVVLKQQFSERSASAIGAPGEPPFRVIGDLTGADRIMNESLFIGVYPGLDHEQLDYAARSVLEVIRPSSGAVHRAPA